MSKADWERRCEYGRELDYDDTPSPTFQATRQRGEAMISNNRKARKRNDVDRYLDEIRERLEAASKDWHACEACRGEPEEVGHASHPCGLVWSREADAVVAIVRKHDPEAGDWTTEQHQANWDMVAHAPIDIAYLLAALRAVWDECEAAMEDERLADTTHGFAGMIREAIERKLKELGEET